MAIVNRSRLLAGIALGTVLAWTCAVQAAEAASPTAAVADAITVTPDQRLARGCRPWTPKGLSFYGRLVPRGWKTDPGTVNATESYSSWTVEAVQWLGGDTLRLQVGLPFLDPASPQAAAGYLDDVRAAVEAARRQGLAVILSMQWEGRTNVKPVEMRPHDSTLRAWRAIAPAFAGDPGVMFELFNEPASPRPPPPWAWRDWHDGHQAVIDALRAMGVRNVLLVDGLDGARDFRGAPPLVDPLRQLAYAIHPYLGADLRTAADYDAHFGAFAQSHAVVATEWAFLATHCASGDAGSSAGLLDWLASRRIGVIGYGADDKAGRLLRGGPARAFRLTTFEGRACTDPEAGFGEQLRRTFVRERDQDERAPPLSRGDCQGAPSAR